MIRYMKKGQDILFFSGEIQIARLIGCSDAEDTLTILEDGIFEWRRQCKPVKKMCMELETCYSSEFYLIPGINYNGNGFGTFCEYEGDRYNGVPWVYGWHRAAIPAMTMSQDEKISVSLIGKANDGESCSLFYKKNSKQWYIVFYGQKKSHPNSFVCIGMQMHSRQRWSQERNFAYGLFLRSIHSKEPDIIVYLTFHGNKIMRYQKIHFH